MSVLTAEGKCQVQTYSYEKGMPAAHTLFQVKSLALIADAIKYLLLLHSTNLSLPERPS